jgi:hypothetical protein
MAPRIKARSRSTPEELAARDAAKAERSRVASLRRPLADRVKKARNAVVRAQQQLREAHGYLFNGRDGWVRVHQRDPEQILKDAEGRLTSTSLDLQLFDLQHGCVQDTYSTPPPTVDLAADAAAESARREAALVDLRRRYPLNGIPR